MSGRPDAAQQDAARTLEEMKRVREIEEQILARAPENDVHPSLERITAVMELAGDPQRTYPTIHLTGTNGKTSTSRMIDAILRESGLSTGRFTSPHLHDIRERITLSGKPISREKFIAAHDEMAPLIDIVDTRSLESGGRRMNFFEVLVALAYAAFADAPVDVAIIEVGLGGSWDATNVIDAQVAVVTPVDLDHTHLLGDDVVSIAEEKSGIIKPGAVTVSGVQDDDVAQVLRDRVEEVGAPDRLRGQRLRRADPRGRPRGPAAQPPRPGGGVRGPLPARARCPPGEQPRHGRRGRGVLHRGRGAADRPRRARGRLRRDDLARTPRGRAPLSTVLVDAAHNPHGARSLVAALDEAFTFTRLVGVVGIVADKDAIGMLEVLEPALDHVVITRSSSPRAMPPDRLGALATEIFGEGRVTVVRDLPDALEQAVTLAESDGMGGGVIATGSVITAGEVRLLLGRTDV